MNQLPVILAVDVMMMSEDEVFALSEDIFELQFIDGSIFTTKQRTIWSWLLWDIHRQYPDTPLLITHHIGDRSLTPMTHANILSAIKTSCKNLYQDLTVAYSNMMALNQVVHESFNNMYNVLTYRLQEYVSTASVLDILEVLNHPTVKELNDTIENADHITAPMIDKVHRGIEQVLMTDNSLIGNSVAIAVRNKLVKTNQLLQCISARGFISEVNDQNFKTPMLTSYSTGMRTLAAFAMDSRTASIAAFSQESTMRSLQYQNRSFQILNSDIRTIHHVDCGTTKTTELFIDSQDKLDEFIGMYRMDEFDKWVNIDTNDAGLLNRPIRVRTIVDCIYPDRHGLCAKCFGDLATSMIDGDSIGQQISAHVQSKLSQGALSVKHYSSNSRDSVYILSPIAMKYFHKHPTKHTRIMINKSLIDRKGYIVFNPLEVENLNNLENVESIKSVSIGRYTKVTSVMVEYTEGDVVTSEVVDIESGTKSASLTTEALTYVLANKWVVDERGNYRVDISRWDVNKPFLQVPRKKADMVQAGKRFDLFLKGVSSRGKSEDDSIIAFNNFGDAMMAFQDLTIEHIPMRVSHMQIMMYGLMAADPNDDDYRLPDPLDRKSGSFVTHRDKVRNGNIATAMAYERQGKILMDPTSFTNSKRSKSDFEYFIMGGEKLD